MSGRVAILTPHIGGVYHDSRWPEVLAALKVPLEAEGLEVEARSWTDAGDLRPLDLVLPLLVWGYHRDGPWEEQVERWERQGVRLRNPAPVLAWNAAKTYLDRLEKAGAPTLPTVFVETATHATAAEAAQRLGTDDLILKPQASAGAFQTIRWSTGHPLEDAPDGPAMIQPYLPSIEREGELSLIYLGGDYSHAVTKVPKSGDFRVQPEHGGILSPHDPSENEKAAAARVLAGVGEDLLYARIDLARDQDGRLVLMEIELIEPDLYLGYDEEAPRRFAAACASAAAR